MRVRRASIFAPASAARVALPAARALLGRLASRGLPASMALLVCAAAMPRAAGAAPATYVLDPQHTFVHFEVAHFGTSTIRGRFGPVAGEVELDREAKRGRVALRIATAGVSTGLALFDARLRESDLLASASFPEAYFVAERLRFDERGALSEVRGEFTFRGVSQPLSLTARFFGCRNAAASEAGAAAAHEVCGGDFEAEVNRGDFGATFGLPLIANRVRLIVQVEGRRREPGAR